jgi:N-acetylmuramic acid 6-phosphate etherase/N-acetylglucosamine-6-phosphate deacetylase
MLIAAPRLFLGDRFTGPCAVEVQNGRITAILPGVTQGDVTLEHGFLAPGLIDLQVNGAFGVGCATADGAAWEVLVNGLAARGVTGFLPTLITAPLADITQAAARVQDAAKRFGAILGLHLEGPFLSSAKRGAHPESALREPSQEALDALLSLPLLKLVTLAPELPGALAAIARLRALGVVVALGHSAASTPEVRAAITAGATLVTHLFNAQAPMTARNPGLTGLGLTSPHLSPCVIADGVHVAPELLALAFTACPRAIAVSDSILLAGLEPGAVREFGGAPVTLSPEGVGVRGDGTLAGAAITLDEGVRRLVRAGIAPEIALAATTSRPGRALGLTDRGVIAPGARADLVWFSDEFYPQKTWLAGQVSAAQPRVSPGTESPREDLADLDERPTLDLVSLFLAQEQTAQAALWQVAPALARLIDGVAARLSLGGRLFYAGAGTSGRLGLLDAVECGPTFGVAPGLIIPLLAGGARAFIEAVEGAEDDEQAAAEALALHGFGATDALVGIAASGRTPFTLAAIRTAKARGGLTGAIVNNGTTPMAAEAEIAVEILSGPEIIAGSTRLSAGSSQKIALNVLSSAVMVRQGKVFGPYMVDMRASNAKLRIRALRMVERLTGASAHDSALALEASGMHVKTAALMLRCRVQNHEARTALDQANGSLRRALRAYALGRNEG